jgi:transposase
MPLPDDPYQYAEWRRARVAPDYHVEVQGHRQVVEVRATEATVEAFHHVARVASHARWREAPATPEHMPSAHRRYAFWTPARLLAAAEKIGPSTIALCEAIMRAKPHTEQGFRSCLGILRLEKTYGAQRLEAACRRGISIGAASYRVDRFDASLCSRRLQPGCLVRRMQPISFTTASMLPLEADDARPHAI